MEIEAYNRRRKTKNRSIILSLVVASFFGIEKFMFLLPVITLHIHSIYLREVQVQFVFDTGPTF